MIPSERSNPFPGLRSFEPDEDHLFFGREAQTDELLRRLRTTRFLAVVGTSGSGKSSLVRSGLIPSLYGGAMSGAGSAWRVAILRPGGNPTGNLADALAAPGALGDAPVPPDRAFLEANLRASRLGLIQSVREAGLPPGDRLLVLVDQFEELFRFRQSGQDARDEALAFVRLLLEAARQDDLQIYVALTMRSEYIGRCMEFPDLPEAINAGLYLVPRMTRDQLRSAIAGPVAVGGGQIALSLVLRLLNDVGDNPDQLPVLQHALMRTWDKWESDHAEGEPLDLRHYEAVGTLHEALSQHADEAYGELDSREKEIAEKMFKALTEPGPDGKGIRRPVSIGEVCALAGAEEAEVLAVVERFRQPGRSFLTLDASSILDLSHESLIRVWGKLSNWVQEEARDAHEYRDLADVAGRHAKKKADLLRGLNLQVALAWRERARPTPVWAQRYDPNFQRTTSFLAESEKAQQRESAEQERKRRSRQRRAWVLMTVLTLATVFSSVMWRNARENRQKAEEETEKARKAETVAVEERNKARKAQELALEQKRQVTAQRIVADRERIKALKSEERERRERERAEKSELKARNETEAADLAKRKAQSLQAQAVIDAENALKLRDEADKQKRQADDSAKTANLEKSRAERLKSLAEARELAAKSLRLQQEKELPLASLLAIQAHKIHRMNRKGFEDESRSYADESDFYRALLSASSRWSEKAERTPTARGRDAKQKQRSVEPGSAESFPPLVRSLKVAVRAVAFGERGQTLVVGTEDGLVHSVPVSRGGAKTMRPFQSGVRSLALGPSSWLHAAGSFGGSLVVWDWPASRPQLRFNAGNQTVGGSRGAVTALAFQPPGGTWLAAGRKEGGVELWTWENGQVEGHRVLETPNLSVASLAFSDKGKTLAVGGKSGILLWRDLEAPEPIRFADDREVWAIDLSPGGDFLAAGTAAGEVYYWDTANNSEKLLVKEASPVHGVRFSSDGKWLAATRGERIQLWKTDHLQDPPLTLSGHKSWVWTLDFSPDHEWLASGSEDGTIRFWPIHLERLVEDVCRRLGKRDLTEDERKLYLDGSGLVPTCTEP